MIPHPGKSDEEQAQAIHGDIVRTRQNMSRTVDEIEARLSPAHLKEQVAEIKQSVLGEYHDAKDHVKEDLSRELREAKAKLEEELRDAKESVRMEIREARMAVRDATVGRVEHMVNDARDTVTDAGTSIVETIRTNPVPAALVAVGLGWLFMSGRSRGNTRSRRVRELRTYGTYGDGGYGGYSGDDGRDRRSFAVGGYGVQERVQDRAQQLASQAADVARDVGTRVEHVARDVGTRVEHVARDVGSRVGHAAHDTAAGMNRFAHDARDQGARIVHGAERQAVRVEQTFETTLRDNPLAVGAVALAVGAAVGLLLPHTEREDVWMGEAKERLIHRAEDLAGDAIQKVETTVTGQLGAGPDTRPEAKNGLSNGLGATQTQEMPKSPSV